MYLGLFPPMRNHLIEFGWIFLRKVVRLRTILCNVEQLPLFICIWLPSSVLQNCFPLSSNNGQTSAVLKILNGVCCRRRSIVQERLEGVPSNWHLFKTLANSRWRHTQNVVHSRNNVCNKHELVALCSALFFRNSIWPMHDHWYVHTAFMRVLLVPAVRSVAHLCPTPRIVRMAVRATNCVNVRNGLVWRFEDGVEEFHLVHNTKRATLLRRAVVCVYHQNGVIQLA